MNQKNLLGNEPKFSPKNDSLSESNQILSQNYVHEKGDYRELDFRLFFYSKNEIHQRGESYHPSSDLWMIGKFSDELKD
jgi:hypothetical protein